MTDCNVDPAEELVLRYLRLVEERDLEAAAALLAPGVRITFPGGRVFANLHEQVASSGGRFRSVKKSFDRVDSVVLGNEVVVYAFGTLAGVGLDGDEFDGVRFLDRFVVREGRIIDQMVWNDLAEVGVVAPDAGKPAGFDEGGSVL